MGLVAIALTEWAVGSSNDVAVNGTNLRYAICRRDWDFDWIGALGQAQFTMF